MEKSKLRTGNVASNVQTTSAKKQLTGAKVATTTAAAKKPAPKAAIPTRVPQVKPAAAATTANTGYRKGAPAAPKQLQNKRVAQPVPVQKSAAFTRNQGAARANIRAQIVTTQARPGGREDAGSNAELQMALLMSRQDQNIDSDMQFIQAMQASQQDQMANEQVLLAQAMSASVAREEEASLRAALLASQGGVDYIGSAAEEEEKQMFGVVDPASHDAGGMSYEQLSELQDVSRGYSEAQIASMPTKPWEEGLTTEANCLICMEAFEDEGEDGASEKLVKQLKCGHEYDATCIDAWLSKEKRCPLCGKPPL